MPDNPLTDVEFDSFNLAPELNQGLADAGFEFCTPIQAKALPRALAGDDVRDRSAEVATTSSIRESVRMPGLSAGRVRTGPSY